MTFKGWQLVLGKVICIRQRYVLGVLGLFVLANFSTMRGCLNMTIKQMVFQSTQSNHKVVGACPGNIKIGKKVPEKNTTSLYDGRTKHNWNKDTQLLLLSAFYYGYVLTHLPGGLLAEKFGGKWTIGVGLLVSSLATLITPWVIRVGGTAGLFIIRAMEGAGQGSVTPGFILMLSRWVPPSERSVFGAMIFGGAQIGNIFGPVISGVILKDGGRWENLFYVFGGLGIVLFVFWTLLCYSTPNSHPFTSVKEREFLNANVAASGMHKKLDPVPFRAILTSTPLWVLVVASIGHNTAYFMMISELPKYFSDVLKLNIIDTRFMYAFPFIAMYVCSILFAYICDLCIRMTWHTVSTGRQIYTTVSSSIPAIFIILASYSGCDLVTAVVMFIFAMGFMGGFYSSVQINAMDIAPNYAGTCSALANGIAAISGIVVPYLIGLLTPDHTMEQWRHAFWYVFVVLVVTNILYLVWGSGDQQWWDDVEKHGYPASWKHGAFKKRTDCVKEIVILQCARCKTRFAYV